MTNVIIIHGSPVAEEEEITYNQHWIPWLKDKLKEKNIICKDPLMPNPWEPVYEDYKKEFEKLNVDENTILIGHSSGTTFLIRWLGETGQKIKKLILVASWKLPWEESRSSKTFCDFKINPKIKEHVDEIAYFTADDEDEEGKKSLEIFHNVLGGKIIELKDHGHFTKEDMGTEEFPELLAEILK